MAQADAREPALTPQARAWRAILAAILAALLGGCYVLREGWHRLGVECGSRRLDSVLADPATPEPTRRALRLVRRARHFAAERLGLAHGAFDRYYDTRGRPVGILVSACEPLAFRPYTWWFPIVGRVPYKGFHDPEDAAREATRLRREGWDVAVAEIQAYSTLGWLRDPFYSTLIDEPPGEIASLVIHEMTHDTIFAPDWIEWDENVASFIGERGALLFLAETYGPDAPEIEAFRARRGEERRFIAYATAVRESLDRLYRAGVPDAEALRLREEIWTRARDGLAGAGLSPERWGPFFDGPANNARLEAIHRYHGEEEPFEELHAILGGRLDALVRELIRIADADDPPRALRLRIEAMRPATAPAAAPAGS